MAAPLEAAETRISDVILQQLLRIQRDGGQARWLTSPAVIEAAPLGIPSQGDLPGLYLHLDNWVDKGLLGAGLHEATATFMVLMYAAMLADAGRELQRLSRDVRKALAEGEDAIQNALKIAGAPTVGDGSVTLEPVGYTFQRELAERLGLAIGSYTFTVTYVWQHSNP